MFAVSSADGSGGERMDCREVIVPVVWVLGRPYRKLLQLRVTLVCDERDTATVPSCSP